MKKEEACNRRVKQRVRAAPSSNRMVPSIRSQNHAHHSLLLRAFPPFVTVHSAVVVAGKGNMSVGARDEWGGGGGSCSGEKGIGGEQR